MRAFVIAMQNEAEAVRPCLRPEDRLYVSGIGKVNAAMATQKAIDEGATEIVNAGTAGGFDPALKVGDVVLIGSAVEYDFDLAFINGTRIGQLNERDSPYIPCGRGTRILATGDRFNDSDQDLKLLAELGCTVRDMEGAAVAHVCERNRIPLTVIKVISDVHGQGAMTEQFMDNLPFALGRLTVALKEMLAR